MQTEAVTAAVVDIPRAAARQRQAMLTFAVEERIGAPIEQVAVGAARPGAGAALNAVLALVISRRDLRIVEDTAPARAGILPDFLGIPCPAANGSGPAWAVWCEAGRAVVRRQDGSGFAVPRESLPAFWERAGRPALTRLADPLPGDMVAADLSSAPPPPDPPDLAFSFPREDRRDHGPLRPLAAAAALAVVGLGLHLALAAFDTLSLSRIAADEEARAEAALAPVLPGVPLSAGADRILARLAPAPEGARRSDFLALLSEVSAALPADGQLTFRRLTWSADALTALLQAPDLERLQAAEQALRSAGLGVESGAASAGDGDAQVEIRLSRAAG